MSKTKIWLIAAAALILLGIILFLGVMALNGWDLKRFYKNDFVTNTYDITEEFSDISVSVNTADVEILPSPDGKCRVVCGERKNLFYEIGVQNGALDISIKDVRKWYEHISLFSFENNDLTLYLPEGEYGRLKLRGSTGDMKTAKELTFDEISAVLSTGDSEIFSPVKGRCEVEVDTGDITVRDISAGELALKATTGGIKVENTAVTGDVKIKVTTGRTKLEGLTCRDLASDGDTGDIGLKDVTADGKWEICRSTGDVSFDSSDAAEVDIETDTGNVTGSFKSDKIIFAASDTGRVDVPKSTAGGRCDVKTNTGKIIITVE